MPWMPHRDPPGEMPAHYAIPIGTDIFDDDQLEYAKKCRKEIGQLRDQLLSFQKECGKRKDIDGARYFRDEAADLMKQYRAWDFIIGYIEGKYKNGWSDIAEPIASYADLQFGLLDLYKYPVHRA